MRKTRLQLNDSISRCTLYRNRSCILISLTLNYYYYYHNFHITLHLHYCSYTCRCWCTTNVHVYVHVCTQQTFSCASRMMIGVSQMRREKWKCHLNASREAEVEWYKTRWQLPAQLYEASSLHQWWKIILTSNLRMKIDASGEWLSHSAVLEMSPSVGFFRRRKSTVDFAHWRP